MFEKTLTVGISAYNEEANLGRLMEDLLRQKEEGFSLEKIMVVSDGSTDGTIEAARGFADPRIRLLAGRRRQGLARRQNQIFKTAKTEILVLIQADTALKDPWFLSKLIRPIAEGKADLTAAKVRQIQTGRAWEKILSVGLRIQEKVFEEYLGGKNLYTCRGPARSFSRKFYSRMRFRESVGEDAFAFLYCLSFGFRYVYVPQAEIFYRLPGNPADHWRQSRRFLAAGGFMAETFGKRLTVDAYRLPAGRTIAACLEIFLETPFYALAYFFLLLLTRLKPLGSEEKNGVWKIAQSTKILNS